MDSHHHPIPIEDAIDLHAFAPRDVVDVVDDYLHAAHDAGWRLVRLIHGRGKGHQRAAVQRLLASHRLVRGYWDAPESHLGATMVQLEIERLEHDACGTDIPPQS